MSRLIPESVALSINKVIAESVPARPDPFGLRKQLEESIKKTGNVSSDTHKLVQNSLRKSAEALKGTISNVDHHEDGSSTVHVRHAKPQTDSVVKMIKGWRSAHGHDSNHAPGEALNTSTSAPGTPTIQTKTRPLSGGWYHTELDVKPSKSKLKEEEEVLDESWRDEHPDSVRSQAKAAQMRAGTHHTQTGHSSTASHKEGEDSPEHKATMKHLKDHVGAYHEWTASEGNYSQHAIQSHQKAHEHLVKHGWKYQPPNTAANPGGSHDYKKGNQTISVGKKGSGGHYLTLSTKNKVHEEVLDEAIVLKNEGHGFGGTINGDKDEHVKKLAPHLKTALSSALSKQQANDHALTKLIGSTSSAAVHRSKLKVGHKMMGHFLDSSHGRHVADALNGGAKHDDADFHRRLHNSAHHFLKGYHPKDFSESVDESFEMVQFDEGMDLTEGAEYVPQDKLPRHVKKAVKGVHAILKKHGVTDARVSVTHHNYKPLNDNHSAGHHEVNVELGHHHIKNDKLVDALNHSQPHKWVHRKGDVTVAPAASIYPSPTHTIHESLEIDEDPILDSEQDNLPSGLDEGGELTEAKIHDHIRDTLAKHGVHADHVGSDKEGHVVVRKGFFYRHGKDSKGWHDRVHEALDKAGVKHTAVDHGEVYKDFRGGAKVQNQSHFWSKVKLHDNKVPKKIDEDLEESLDDDLIEEFNTHDQASNRKEYLDKKHPRTMHEVVQGRRSGKYFVVRRNQHGAHVAEAVCFPDLESGGATQTMKTSDNPTKAIGEDAKGRRVNKIKSIIHSKE